MPVPPVQVIGSGAAAAAAASAAPLSNSPVLYRGTLHAFQAVYLAEGWRGFYAGLSPALVGSGIAYGAYFYL